MVWIRFRISIANWIRNPKRNQNFSNVGTEPALNRYGPQHKVTRVGPGWCSTEPMPFLPNLREAKRNDIDSTAHMHLTVRHLLIFLCYKICLIEISNNYRILYALTSTFS